MDASEIRSRLHEQAEAVCQFLLPGGRRSGGYWNAGGVDGSSGENLRVCLSGPKVGIWNDFHPTAATKPGGLFDLWMQVRNVDFKEMLQQAADWLGVPAAPKEPPRKIYQKPVPKLAEARIGNPTKKYLEGRGINWTVASEAGCRHGGKAEPCTAFLSFKPGVEDAVSVKYINHELNEKGKKTVSTEAGAEPVLFGMCSPVVQAHTGTLTITEGECDCLSWLTIGVPAVSVPFGAKGENAEGKSPNDEWIENCFDFLAEFHTIIVNMDNDDEGRKAETAIVKRLGTERCRALRLPKKDANELLKAGELTAALLEQAVSLDPANIMFFGEGFEQAWKDGNVRREDTGHRLLDWDYDFRVRPGETTVVLGYDGGGKSNFMAQVAAWLACVKHEPVFIGSYEDGYEKTRKKMCYHALGRNFDPSEKGLYKQILDALEKMVIFHRFKGEANYEEYFEALEYCVKRFGVRHGILDCVTSTNVDLDDLKSADKFVKRGQRFANSNPLVHSWYVMHPKKTQKSDESIIPLKNDIRGSAVFSNLIWNVLTVFKCPEGAVESWDAKIVCSKQREGGKRPTVTAYYNEESYRLQQDMNDNTPYIQIAPTVSEADCPF